VSDWTDYVVTTNAPIEKVEAVLAGLDTTAQTGSAQAEVDGANVTVSFFGKKAEPNSFIFAREVGYDGFSADRRAV
jgi:hypothetical protein